MKQQTNDISLDTTNTTLNDTSRSLWALGWKRLKKDKVGYISLMIVVFYLLLSLASGLGLIASHWRDEIALPYAPPSFATWEARNSEVKAIKKEQDKDDSQSIDVVDPLAALMAQADNNADQYKAQEITKADSLILGGDSRGRDILQKVLKGTSVSVSIALFGAFCSIIIGTVLGAIAGYFGKWVDDFLMWFYSIFTSIPDMLLLLSFAVVFSRGISTLVLIFALTSWTGVFRVMRAEFMQQKDREYVKAANAIGASHLRKMFLHILPNVSHLLLVQFSLLTVGMLKSEAVLSFLGFGVSITQTSWGSMLAEGPPELLQGYWWQLLTVTVFMSVLVTAFSLLTDSLRDALDPKVK